ncbi:MAG: BadF/BadG/BcrA/BcrD ATPase family protein [Pseudomonadota bacterium]
MNAERARLCVGLDIGSTTVKTVVVERASRQILWRDYRRHEARQLDVAADMIERLCAEIGARPGHDQLFVTGSGAQVIAEAAGVPLVHEVNAVVAAARSLYPSCRSIIELGGQDAKIIVFRENGDELRRHASMNDKCAGGTGSVIDKLGMKLGFDEAGLSQAHHAGLRIHPVAAKCGVFAETDLIGLQKQGVPEDELLASLFDAIVMQNLAVLTRGFTLLPDVLLVGGPHAFIPGMVEAWREAIPRTWSEREVGIAGDTAAQHILVPDGAHDFAALGAILAGLEDGVSGALLTPTAMRRLVETQRQVARTQYLGEPLVVDDAELKAFHAAYATPRFETARLAPGETVRAYLGIDGGSTSTKAVLMAEDGSVLAKCYRLSCGNPIVDVKKLAHSLCDDIGAQGARLEILGCATTGYAKDILHDALKADVALVETVAHAKSAIALFGPDIDVICDVGGQDIKLIFLRDGNVVDFRLNTQCSAGNGYFLQGTAIAFGLPVEQYAEHAFAARVAPRFSYGCAVFLQTDIADFQRRGFSRDEILAGLCRVLPRNIWLYIAKMPNLARLGRRFVLQGGTQYNLAAVKAQVDYIVERFEGSGSSPDVRVHPHAGEGGAIGAALEAQRLVEAGHRSTFIGLDALANLELQVTRDETTRCGFCNNNCMRTFVDVDEGPAAELAEHLGDLAHATRRLIVAPCETGMAASAEAMKAVNAQVKAVKHATPNLVAEQARDAFKPSGLGPVASDLVRVRGHRWARHVEKLLPAAALQRDRLRIGIPRVMSNYSLAPFWRAYFESLGVLPDHLVFSPPTSEKLFKDGTTRGAIDPCFPSKLAQAHVHHLLYRTHTRQPLDAIFFPMVDALPTFLEDTERACACPTTTSTPTTVRAAFCTERDVFAELGVPLLSPLLAMDHPDLVELELFQSLAGLLGLRRGENRRAVQRAFDHLQHHDLRCRERGLQVIRELERTGQVGIVVLSRPYHADPGVNHGIVDELQKRGYAVLATDSLPLHDPELLARVFADDPAHALRVSDVWKNSFSENTNRKLWAAKFVARHPNLVALELSSFKCGHDAAVNTVVEKILGHSGTPHFAFKEIDENRPAGAIKIRVETIAYFLERYRQRLQGHEGRVDLGLRPSAPRPLARGQEVQP